MEHHHPQARRNPPGRAWLFAYGLVLIVLGLLAWVSPLTSAIGIGLFMACALCVAGVIGIVAGVRAGLARGHWLDLAAGLVALFFGLVLLPFPLAGAALLLWTTSMWFLLTGFLELAAGWRNARERGGLLLVGSLDLALAVFLLFGFVNGDVWQVPLLAGASFIASGLLSILTALRKRPAMARSYGPYDRLGERA